VSIAIIIALLFVVTLGFVVAFGAPYVPSKRSDLRRAFDELYELKPIDLVVDLGSGDGVVLREVSRRGAKALGYELNPLLVGLSRHLSRGDANVSVNVGNLWTVTFPNETSVVYIFGESRDIKRLERKIQDEANRLQKMLIVISYGFQLKAHSSVKQAGAHFRYDVVPSQRDNHKL
jgi:SAM-dependent methyltransferase